MRPSLRRMLRTVVGLEVDQAAACARALTAMVGQMPAVELLPGGPAQLTRARLTARALSAWSPAPWPHAVMRQQDPSDPAFLPALGVHPVLAARDVTLLGMPDGGPKAWVDPDGWAGVGTGPAVGVWFGDETGAFTLGRSFGDGIEAAASQRRSDSRVGLRTTREVRGLECVVVHWPVLLDGRVVWVVHVRVQSHAELPRKVRMGVVVRPATLEGVRPIFRLQRSAEGVWSADGTPVMLSARPGDRTGSGRLATHDDPWQGFSDDMGAWPRPGRIDLRCPMGSCSGGEFWSATLAPGASLSRFAVLGPTPSSGVALSRTTADTLFESANADRRGLLAAGCPVRFSPPSDGGRDINELVEAARVRLLIGAERGGLAGCIGAVALARLGFTRRAGDRLAAELARVRRNGEYRGDDAEDAAVLAWAAGQYVMWTGDRAWLGEQSDAWARLLDHIHDAEPAPGGRPLFGMGGSRRWTRIWQAAGLIASAWVLRKHPRHAEWTLAGGRIREDLQRELGAEPWTADDGRAPDGTSVAALTAVWVGILPPTLPGVRPTLALLSSRFWHGGGVLMQGGAHTAGTCIHQAVMALADDTYDPLATIAALAGPTGAFPTARHPARGALGDGDDPLAAALFSILALDRIRARPRRLKVLPGIEEAHDLPTPFGRIDVETHGGKRKLVGRWWGQPPAVEVV